MSTCTLVQTDDTIPNAKSLDVLKQITFTGYHEGVYMKTAYIGILPCNFVSTQVFQYRCKEINVSLLLSKMHNLTILETNQLV